MRPSSALHRPFRRRPERVDAPAADAPWPAPRVLAESEHVLRRVQQLESRPWWRVSSRELDELDARLATLQAHAAGMSRG
jgi:hypothetical protein